MKCPECSREMNIADSNLFNDEYWEGYKCICGNVELVTMTEDEYNTRIADDDYISKEMRYMKSCPDCNGYLDYRVSEGVYVCIKCERRISLSNLYCRQTGGLQWRKRF